VPENKTRWEIAQEYEKKWWRSRVDFITLDFYQDYAADLAKDMEGILKIREDSKILEIGSGAAGILTFLNSNFRYAVDPLEDFYSSV
jgi:hypothetical protein